MPNLTATRKEIDRRLGARGPFYDPRNRFQLFECFEKLPALNAVTALPGSGTTSPTAAEFLAYTLANKSFGVSGGNATTALCTQAAGGGITLTTAGGANKTDSEMISPLVNTSQMSAWGSTLWSLSKNLIFRAWIQTPAATPLASIQFHAKMALTAALNLTTDDEQFGFSILNGNWILLQSIAGTDSVPTFNSARIPVAALASTEYELAILLDSSRVPYFYINGFCVGVGAATSTTGTPGTWAGLAPVVGVIQHVDSVVAAITVRGLQLSRAH